MNKPYSSACERNKDPIYENLRHIFVAKDKVLEIGSGTGQHAIYFSQKLPHLTWQTSDLQHNHDAIFSWLNESDLTNICDPLLLDVSEEDHWPDEKFQYIYTANTCHIMSWADVENMFRLFRHVLKDQGSVCIYGPFNYNNQYTSDSNKQFDFSLKQTNPQMGIRDIEKILELAKNNNLSLEKDYAMPANNRLLHLRLIG